MKNRLEENIWYKNSIIYQLHVKSFFDSNNNGFGDFKGLSLKLDYLESLGINTIWLLPFYPSPLRDDGYDISNYLNVHSDYGTLNDFKFFLKESHKRDIKVIIELVINHTSDQHMWFQRARIAPKNSKERNYYMWSENNEKYKEARIIFKDFEISNWTWDPVAKEYYWHRFFSHQPDLNFDNPYVHKEIFKVVDFWFKLGVDGMRLDAIPYLYAREGTTCENLPETHIFLKKLRKHVDEKFPGKMLLAEANQWPEDIIQYFGDGDECHMTFHFPVMPRIFMSLKMEDRFPITDILNQTPKIPENCQWVIFLRNHDELTLEMVTDEERDYMYRVYASDQKARINLGIRRRLAPLVNNDINQIRLLNSILFSLPGTPVIYYGDEIGMGDNYYLGDRNGVRTPMQWSSDKNAGFSKADQRELYLPVITDPQYHYEAVNVENNDKNPDSLLWFIRQLISIRKQFKSLGKGSFRIVQSNNNKILSFLRSYEDEEILVIINLSKNVQFFELYLNDYNSFEPEEVFGKSVFPLIGKDPYNLTISPLSFYWLLLRQKIDKQIKNFEILYLSHKNDELGFFEKKLLKRYLNIFNSFNKTLTLVEIEIIGSVEISEADSMFYLFKAYYNEDLPQFYSAFISRKKTFDLNYLENIPNESILIKVNEQNEKELFFDGFNDRSLRKLLFDNLTNHKNIKIENLNHISVKKHFVNNSNSWLVESSSKNYLINYDNKIFLKIYKNFEFNSRPEIELINFLSKKDFKHIPIVSKKITYRYKGKKAEIGIIQDYIVNEGSFWDFSQKELKHFFESIIPQVENNFELNNLSVFKEKIKEYIGVFYLDLIDKLAERTSQMHSILGSDTKDPLFFPESFTIMYQHSIYQTVRTEIKKTLEILNDNQKNINIIDHEKFSKLVIDKERLLMAYIKKIISKKFNGQRIRNHGEFNLKQILFTGKDFVFIDFDGISIRPFSERKIKRSCLREISFLFRSFHYVVYSVLINEANLKSVNISKFYIFAEIWYEIITKTFLNSYFKNLESSLLLPESEKDRLLILNILLLNKFFSSVNYELYRKSPELVIPLIGIKNILKNIEGEI